MVRLGELMYEKAHNLSKALSRGFSAPKLCTARIALICVLQQFMVVLSYGLVCHAL